MSGWPVCICFSYSESQIFPAHWVQPAVHHFTSQEKLVPDPRYKSQGQMKIKIAGVSPILPRGSFLPQIVPFHGEGNCTKDNNGRSETTMGINLRMTSEEENTLAMHPAWHLHPDVGDHHFGSDRWLGRTQGILCAVCNCESACMKEGCQVC